MLYKGKFQPDQLPPWLRGDSGRKYAYPLLFVVWFSAGALVIFGFTHLVWYCIPLELLAGLLASAVSQVLFGNVVFLLIGPPLLLSLQAGLWMICR
jgi:hypothetical protein